MKHTMRAAEQAPLQRPLAKRWSRARIAAWTILLALAGQAAGDDFDQAPIHYKESIPTDRIQKLASQLTDGKQQLEWDAQHGWLRSILKVLAVPAESQTLVFSKTSLQFRRITPAHPRAVYFNDDIYVGWVSGGEVLELSAVDPKLGAVFYTIDQRRSERATIVRDRGECLACHANSRTQRVPGYLVRSVYPTSDGQPEFRLGTLTTDHRTPFRDRFGGWYVTGNHGEMTHRGNGLIQGEGDDPLDRQAGANLSELPPVVTPSDYVTPSSDIVALLLLEHQSQMHNYVTKAGYAARRALHHQKLMNRILEEPESRISDSTRRRIESAADELVEYTLFCKEYRFDSPVKGGSDFTKVFTASGITDSKGRSLKQLDLKNRLLKHPCSYLIYSDAFMALPKEVLDRVKNRMEAVLSGEDPSDDFSHLSVADRQAILGILRETHPLFGGAIPAP